jgi:hypothetical protein
MKITGDLFKYLPKLKTEKYNLIFGDPPYNLGSSYKIDKKDNKVKYINNRDFMNKWEGLTAKQLDIMFKEFFRVLKPGGFCVLYCQDRQSFPFQYYALKNGFNIGIQKVYTFQISSFPKSLDISKNLDRNNGRNYNIDFKNYLNEQRKIKNYSYKDINKLMQVAISDGGFSSSIMGDKEKNELPTLEMYKKLKTILNLDDRFDELIEKEEAEREIIGKKQCGIGTGKTYAFTEDNNKAIKNIDITKPVTKLAEKYNGWKYSISPFKQCVEEVLIFRKDTGNSAVKDVLDYEDGKNVSPSLFNIDENRVKYKNQDDIIPQIRNNKRKVDGGKMYRGNSLNDSKTKAVIGGSVEGRYPTDLYLVDGFNYTREQIDSYFEEDKLNETGKNIFFNIGIDIEVLDYMTKEKAIDYICNYLDKFKISKILDDQSGELKSGGLKSNYNLSKDNKFKDIYSKIKRQKENVKGDFGGCSRVIEKCKYELEEFNLINYYQKPSKKERNAGLNGFDKKNVSHDGRHKFTESPYQRHNNIAENHHPTLKSLKLNYKISSLFILPDKESFKILNPFSGVRSERIGIIKNGIPEENIDSIEIDKDYEGIGQAREKYWKDINFKVYKETKKIKKDRKNKGIREFFIKD